MNNKVKFKERENESVIFKILRKEEEKKRHCATYGCYNVTKLFLHIQDCHI